VNYYIAKCSELNLLICIKYGLWAQERNRMSRWKPKDKLFLIIEDGRIRKIAGLFKVTSEQFIDDTRVWTDKTYPYRVNINPIKVLAPENRISLDEHNIKNDLLDLYGRGWGMKIVMSLSPLDSNLARNIQKVIEAQPSYDPLLTIDEDIKRLTDLIGMKPQKISKTKIRKKEILIVSGDEEKSLHDSIIEIIASVGKWEGKYSDVEYPIGNLGRLDAVWKRIKTGNPSYAFEVQIKGNFYQALAKLKHAFDLWNSIPVLVTTEQYVIQAEELLSGSFHEMRKQAKIINYEKIQELFLLEKKLHELKDELDL
jgi:predicted RNA-binding protein